MPRRRAQVTGASRGLGEHVASRLAEQGWTVTGVGRRPATELPELPKWTYVSADLADPGTVDLVVDRVGPALDLIVHCAVTHPEPGEVCDSADLDRMFRVNALAPYLLTRTLLRAKPDDLFCCCVMVNSEAIFQADSRSCGYAATKAALRVMTSGLADECRSGTASVATLLLGPLADPRKLSGVREVARKRGMSEDEVAELFLRKSNPNLVINRFIDYEACFRSIVHIFELGPVANGMVCKLDGGSSGSLF